MSITTNIELQQAIANLQQRFEVPVKYLTKEDLVTLTNFLDDTTTFLYFTYINITTVSDNINNINIVANNTTNINNIVSNIDTIIAMGEHVDEIDRVFLSIDEIDRLFTSIINIDRLYTSVDNLDRLHTSITELDRVYTSISKVDRVYTSIDNIDRLHTSVDKLDTLYTSITNLDRLHDSILKLDRLFTSIDNIDRVYTSIGNIDAIYTDITNIDSVATNIVAVADVSTNMTSVLGASANAATATTQAGLASGYASDASAAKIAAESARDSTLTAFDNFDDRYLGAKIADPIVDNDGNPLIGGTLYFNSVSGVMRLYNGTIWVAAYVSSEGLVVAPATNSADYLPQWDGVNSKLLKNGLAVPTGGLAGLTAPIFTGTSTIPSVNMGLQSIVTTGGTTTFTSSIADYVIFTGSQGQTVILPNATTLSLGRKIRMDNDSTQSITIKTNGGTDLWIIAPSCDLYLTCTNISTTTGIWEKDYSSAKAVSGKSLTINNSLTLTGTDNSSIAFGTGGTVLYNGGALGTPSSGTLTNCTFPSITTLGGVVSNSSITGATKIKITYDSKGLITSGADATTADIADSTDKRYCTDAQKTVISNTSGTNTGDQTITLTGDVTGSGTSSFATTLTTVNSNVGTFGSSISIPVVTVNAKGLVTGVSTATVAGGQYFGAAATKAIAYNSSTISENVTITSGNNGLSAGPITITNSYTVTIESGSNWTIVGG